MYVKNNNTRSKISHKEIHAQIYSCSVRQRGAAPFNTPKIAPSERPENGSRVWIAPSERPENGTHPEWQKKCRQLNSHFRLNSTDRQPSIHTTYHFSVVLPTTIPLTGYDVTHFCTEHTNYLRSLGMSSPVLLRHFTFSGHTLLYYIYTRTCYSILVLCTYPFIVTKCHYRYTLFMTFKAAYVCFTPCYIHSLKFVNLRLYSTLPTTFNNVPL